MYVLQLWSSLMANDHLTDKNDKTEATRKENNIAETNFRIVKHTTLEKLNNMPVTITSQFLLRINSQAILYDLSGVAFLNSVPPVSMVNDVWFDKKVKPKVKTRSPYYNKTDLNKLDQTKKGKKRRHSKIKRLSSSMKGISLSTSQEQNDFDCDYDEDDDDVFEPKKNAQKALYKKTKAAKGKSEKENSSKSRVEKIVDNFLINFRSFQQSIPTNECSFKERGEPEVIFINSCTIDYFLFSLWVTCQADQKFLIGINKEGGFYENLAIIIEFINIGAWAKAKHHWVSNCLKMDADKTDKKHVFDCFGKLSLRFVETMSLLQKFKVKKVNCDNSNGIIGDYSWVSLSNKLQLNKASCKNKCGKCSWDEIIFESVPFWFVRELNNELKSIGSLIEEFKDLVIDDKVKYKLLCLYDFIKDTENEKLNHFKGIFYLNSKFIMVDNLLSDEFFELKPDYLVCAACIIYYKA